MALAEKSVTAIVPTRGDLDLTSLVEHLKTYQEIDDVILVQGNTPHNRYRAARFADHDVIFTQDDDCLTDLRPLLDSYEPGIVVNAMTPAHAANYPGRQTLIGFGAIFDRKLMDCFDGFVRDDLFYRESDRIFATVHQHKTVFPSIMISAAASAPNRLWKQPDHVSARFAMERRIKEVTGIEP